MPVNRGANLLAAAREARPLRAPSGQAFVAASLAGFLAASLGVLVPAGCRAPLPPPVRPLAATEDADFRAQPPVARRDSPSPGGEDLTRIEEARLPNGLRVWVVHRPWFPVVALSFAVRIPPAWSATFTPELINLTARAMVEDDTLWRGGESVRPPLINGRQIGFSTSPDGVTLTEVVSPSSLAAGVEVVARTALTPAFREDRFESSRRAEILAAQYRYSRVKFQLLDTSLVAQFGPSAAGRIGATRPDEVRKLDRAAVIRCHQQLFRPEAAVLVAVGNVTLADVVKEATAHFGTWAPASASPGGPPPTVEAPWISQTRGRRLHLLLHDTSQNVVMVLQVGPDGTALADYLPFQLLAAVVSGSGDLATRANVALRHDLGATYGVDAEVDRVLDRLVLTLMGAFETERIEQATRALLDVLVDVRTRTVSEAELAGAKERFKGQLRRQLAGELPQASLLSALFQRGLARESIASIPGRIDRVTVEDVRRVAERYLDPVNVEIAVTGGRSVAEPLSRVADGEVYRFKKGKR